MAASPSALTYNLAEILPGGLEIDRDLSAVQLDLAPTDALVEGPIHVTATLHRDDPRVTVTGLLDGTAVRQCVRCLKNFSEPLLVSFTGEYAKKSQKAETPPKTKPGKAPAAPTPEEEDAEADRYEFVGEQVDLVPMLREQVILAEPMRPLCNEDCLGLCPVCGLDRNQSLCTCQVKEEGSLGEKIRAAQAQRRRPSGPSRGGDA
ncbi:MAG: DUF177 domain-containing protein [Nitrospiraceae bacterium]